MFNPYFHQTSQSQTVIPPPSLTPVGTRSNKRDDQFVNHYMQGNNYMQTANQTQFQYQHRPVVARPSQFSYHQTQHPVHAQHQVQQTPSYHTHAPQQQHVLGGQNSWTFISASATNPFDVLGLPRNTTDETIVDNTFRQWVSKLHPDRGGDPRKLDEIKNAYDKVKEILSYSRNESFESLKNRAEHDLSNMHTLNGGFQTGTKNGAANPELAPLGNGKQFDERQFNQIFENNRLRNPNDDGYGANMVSSEYVKGQKFGEMTVEQLMAMRTNDTLANVHMVQGYDQLMNIQKKDEYNKQLNNMFQSHILSDQYQRMQHQQYQAGQMAQAGGNHGMVVRREPESADSMYRSSTSLCTALSVDKVDDFSSPFSGGSGNAAGGGYTDYMKAFSNDSLITPHVMNAQGNGIMTVEQLERERAQLSHLPSMELLRETNMRLAAEKEADNERWRRYNQFDEQIEAHNMAIRNLLPTKSVLK